MTAPRPVRRLEPQGSRGHAEPRIRAAIPPFPSAPHPPRGGPDPSRRPSRQVRPRGRTLTLRRPRGAAPIGRDGRRQQQQRQQQRRGSPRAAAARDAHGRRGGCGQRPGSAGGERGGGSGRCVRAPCPPRSDTPGPAPPGPRAPASFSHGPPGPPLPAPSLLPRGPGGGGAAAVAGGRLSAGRGRAPSPPRRPRAPNLPLPRRHRAPPVRGVLQLDPVPLVRTNSTFGMKYSDTGHPESVLCISESYSPQTSTPPMGLDLLSAYEGNVDGMKVILPPSEPPKSSLESGTLASLLTSAGTLSMPFSILLNPGLL